MRVILLGTGNAPGVPVHGCPCKVCTMARGNLDYHRRPASALLEMNGTRYLIDAGIHNLAERFPDGSLDGIFLTHFHPDHVLGLFHLRWGVGRPVNVYCPPDSQGCADLFTHPGPLKFVPLSKFSPLVLGELHITPIPLIHSKPTLGYVFQNNGVSIAYLTDTVGLPEKTEKWLKQNPPDILILDASHPPASTRPRNHNDLTMAINIHCLLNPRNTVLTHIGHDLDRWLMDNPGSLPDNLLVGRDDLAISL